MYYDAISYLVGDMRPFGNSSGIFNMKTILELTITLRSVTTGSVGFTRYKLLNEIIDLKH